MRPAAALALVAAVAGCAGSSDEPEREPQPAPERFSDARVIRGWIAALNAGSYESAASYFARGAVVEQTREFRLTSREEAVVFNQSLPCRGDVAATKDEGRTTLATFRLRRGPGGPCHGTVRVRCTIRAGKFTQWRQLPEAPPPRGEVS
jgi:hypothetical protein